MKHFDDIAQTHTFFQFKDRKHLPKDLMFKTRTQLFQLLNKCPSLFPPVYDSVSVLPKKQKKKRNSTRFSLVFRMIYENIKF